MTLFKVFKGEKAPELLKYNYKYLVFVDSFEEFDVYASDSPSIPEDRIITEEELEKLRKERGEEVM